MIQSGYTKLFGTIVASTIWREDDKTRIVWITLLALSDKNGYVAGSIPGLADLARVSLEDCEHALQKLQQPDKYSRSPEHNGRRIEVVEGGWLILNRAKYRDLVPEEHRRECDRIRQRRHREKQKEQTVTVSRVTERDSHDLSPQKEKEEEKETKAKAKTNTEASARRARSRLQFLPPTLDEVAAYCCERGNQVDPQHWFDHYSSNGWRVGRNPMKDWKASVRSWERNGVHHAAPAPLGGIGRKQITRVGPCSTCNDSGEVNGSYCNEEDCEAARRLFLQRNPDPGRIHERVSA